MATGDGIDLNLRGVPGFDESLGKMLAAVNAAALHALVTEAEVVMTKSKRLVPVDTGTLRSSGRVGAPKVKPGQWTIRLSYGGPAQEYAIYVHEDLEARHTNGQAKFLEQPVREHAPEFAKSVGETLRRALRRGI